MAQSGGRSPSESEVASLSLSQSMPESGTGLVCGDSDWVATGDVSASAIESAYRGPSAGSGWEGWLAVVEVTFRACAFRPRASRIGFASYQFQSMSS